MWKQVNCLMPKLAVLISTFHIECIIKFIIHINVTPNAANVRRWWETGWRQWWSLSNQAQYVFFISAVLQQTSTDRGSVVLSALCHQSAVVLHLTPKKQSLCLIYMYQAGGCLLWFYSASSRANRRPRWWWALRFLWSPAGSCCLSSKCGPGSIFSTSSMLRHPGLARTWVSRMLRGA